MVMNKPWVVVATVLATNGCNGDSVTPTPQTSISLDTDDDGSFGTGGADGVPPSVTTLDGGPPVTSGPLDTTAGAEFGTTFFDEGTTFFDEGTTFFDEGTTFFDEGTTFFDEGTTVFDEGTTVFDEGTTVFETTFSDTDAETTFFGTTVFSATVSDTSVTTTPPTDEGPGTEGDLACIEVDLGSAVGMAVATGTNEGGGDDLAQNCAGSDGPDIIHVWTPPNAGTWTFDTIGSDYDTALTLFHTCNDSGAFACNDDGGPGTLSEITVDLAQDETILIVVEGWNASTGDFQLNIDGVVVDPGTTTDGTTTDDGTTDDSTTDDGTTTGDPLDAFEAPQPFGDSVLETDLIGTWNLPTDGSNPGYSMSLTINMDGSFVWEELDGACMLVREGTGVLWVAGAQLVMLFETFDGLAPWPVFEQFGYDADPPFLVRAGYAPVLGHIAITAPPELRLALPWASRGYARTVGGTTALDVWVAETELWDVAPGQMVADIISRDRHTLDIVAGPTATHTFQRFWYEGGVQTADPAVVEVLPYTDDLVGNLVLDGAAYTYVGARMASYEPGDNFQLDAPSACP